VDIDIAPPIFLCSTFLHSLNKRCWIPFTVSNSKCMSLYFASASLSWTTSQLLRSGKRSLFRPIRLAECLSLMTFSHADMFRILYIFLLSPNFHSVSPLGSPAFFLAMAQAETSDSPTMSATLFPLLLGVRQKILPTDAQPNSTRIQSLFNSLSLRYYR